MPFCFSSFKSKSKQRKVKVDQNGSPKVFVRVHILAFLKTFKGSNPASLSLKMSFTEFSLHFGQESEQSVCFDCWNCSHKEEGSKLDVSSKSSCCSEGHCAEARMTPGGQVSDSLPYPESWRVHLCRKPLSCRDHVVPIRHLKLKDSCSTVLSTADTADSCVWTVGHCPPWHCC